MANMIDYLKWRGDITFKERPFNETDNLILTRISYFPFEKILDNNKVITIEEAYKISLSKNLNKNDWTWTTDIELFELLSKSDRYKNLKLRDFENKFCEETVKQFAVITIVLPKNCIYISYRGTDSTIIGWKEDFNMTYLDNIPSQLDALNYINNLKNGFFTKIKVGGHSKGGNLAVYAAMHTTKRIKRKIELITNIDGPGFLKEVIDSPDYKDIKTKVKTYIPQTSIIGKFLNVDEGYITVKSNEKSIMQHDIYSWEIQDNNLVYLDDVDKDSTYITNIINEWLNNLSIEDREKMINIIFKMLSDVNLKTLKEIDQNKFKSIKSIISSYKKISKEDKKMLYKFSKYLFSAIKKVYLTKEKEN